MNHKLILLIIIGAIVLSSIYPVRYYYVAKEEANSLPKYTSYKEAIFVNLANLIREKAGNSKCSGFIIPLERVESPNSSLSNLVNDINLVLAKYPSWKLVVDTRTERELREYKDKLVTQFKDLDPGTLVKDLVLAKWSSALQTKYKTRAQWSYIDKSEANNVSVIVRVIEIKSETELFNAYVNFLHPVAENALKNGIAVNQARRKTLAKRADFSKKVFWGSNLVLLSYILVVGTNSVIRIKRRQKTSEFLLKEIQKREELVKNGHFVTAFELANKYLQYFPDDSEIKAFRERLLDFTNNDPKIAQVALVEAQKLKLRIEQYGKASGRIRLQLLDSGEKRSIVPLLPYNSELNAYYSEVLQLENKEKTQIEFATKLKSAQNLYSQGYLNKALEQIVQLQKNHSDNSELTTMLNTVQERRSDMIKNFQNVGFLFRDGELEIAIREFEIFMSNYKDLEAGLILKKEIDASKGLSSFRLKSLDGGKPITIFCKNDFVVGRMDDDSIPDIEIDDKRISRKHAQFSIVDDFIVVEDMNSTGSTFVNCEKIMSRKLHHGDIVNLAKCFDMSVSIFREKNDVPAALLLQSRENNYLVVPRQIKFAFQNGELSLEHQNYAIYHNNRLTVIVLEHEFSIMRNGVDIIIGNHTYQIEAQ